MSKITPKYEIKVTYFKPSGKYYAEGFYMTSEQQIYKVFEEFERMLCQGKRPGLCKGNSGFTAILDCSRHPLGYPAMFPNKA